MNQDFSIFAKSIDQVHVLDHLVSEMKALKAKIVTGQEGKITDKVTDLPKSVVAIFNYLEASGLEPSSDSGQRDYLDQIITYLKSLPMMKLKLAFEADEIFIKNLSQVLNNLVGHKVVLDISVDHKIVAGLQIEYQGKFLDLSYEKPTEDYIKNKLPGLLQQDFEAKTV